MPQDDAGETVVGLAALATIVVPYLVGYWAVVYQAVETLDPNLAQHTFVFIVFTVVAVLSAFPAIALWVIGAIISLVWLLVAVWSVLGGV